MYVPKIPARAVLVHDRPKTTKSGGRGRTWGYEKMSRLSHPTATLARPRCPKDATAPRNSITATRVSARASARPRCRTPPPPLAAPAPRADRTRRATPDDGSCGRSTLSPFRSSPPCGLFEGHSQVNNALTISRPNTSQAGQRPLQPKPIPPLQASPKCLAFRRALGPPAPGGYGPPRWRRGSSARRVHAGKLVRPRCRLRSPGETRHRPGLQARDSALGW
jgi:hypothetical protein